MEHTLRIDSTAENLPGPIRIEADGCLTDVTFLELISVVRQGAVFGQCPELEVDLRRVDHLEVSALDAVEVLVSWHNYAAVTPLISIEYPPRAAATTESYPVYRCGLTRTRQHNGVPRTASDIAQLPDVADTVVVADLMAPVGAAISMTQSLQQAAEKIRSRQRPLVVTSLTHKPFGVLIAADLRKAAGEDPEQWPTIKCAAAVQFCEQPARAEHSIEGVIQLYRQQGAQPQLVFKGETPVGLLEPDAVFQWYRDHAASFPGEVFSTNPATMAKVAVPPDQQRRQPTASNEH